MELSKRAEINLLIQQMKRAAKSGTPEERDVMDATVEIMALIREQMLPKVPVPRWAFEDKSTRIGVGQIKP